MDDVLSNTISGIQDNIRLYTNLIDFKNARKHKTITNSERTALIIKSEEKTYEFKTLCNYAKIVAKNNNLSLTKNSFQICISKTEMAQFTDRNKHIEMPEEIIFKSNLINLKQLLKN